MKSSPTTLSLCVKTPGPVLKRFMGPENCRGALSDCLARDPGLTEAKWYRGQMRAWAGYWRERRLLAAMVGRSVQEVANTYLSLAKTYRDGALKLEAK